VVRPWLAVTGQTIMAKLNAPARRATVYPKALRITPMVGVINVFSLS
jgi:hypothetical protein